MRGPPCKRHQRSKGPPAKSTAKVCHTLNNTFPTQAPPTPEPWPAKATPPPHFSGNHQLSLLQTSLVVVPVVLRFDITEHRSAPKKRVAHVHGCDRWRVFRVGRGEACCALAAVGEAPVHLTSSSSSTGPHAHRNAPLAPLLESHTAFDKNRAAGSAGDLTALTRALRRGIGRSAPRPLRRATTLRTAAAPALSH